MASRGPAQPVAIDRPASPAGSISLSDWYAMDEDEPGEYVDGRLEEEEVPDFVHETVVAWLIFVLRTWLKGKGGFVAGSEAKFAVLPQRGRKPDVSVYLPAGRVPPARGLIRTPPDLVVEVISPGARNARRDRLDKVADYAAFGVRWYWLVDPELQSFQVLELRDGVYAHVVGAVSGTLEGVPGCDGLSLSLDELWAEVDRLGPSDPEPA